MTTDSTPNAERATAALLVPDMRELIASRQYRDLRDALRDLDPHDIAEIIEELEIQEAIVALRVLPRETASVAFSELESSTRQELLEGLGEERSTRLVEEMDADDRAALLDELPAPIAKSLLQRLTPETRRVTRMILGYPEETVGRLMTPDYVRLGADWTVTRALEHIREFGHDAETLHWMFIVDDNGKLVSELHIRRILLAEPDEIIGDLGRERVIALHATDDQEEAVRLMADYDRSALPVIDATGALVGVITHDDIADVAEAEATEDIQKLGGLAALDDPYLETSVPAMLRKRGIWLAVLMIAQAGAIWVMGSFEAQLEAMVVLALFIPMIISTGGNTGTQTASLLIRALAIRELGPSKWAHVLGKEFATGLLLGIGLGFVGFSVAFFLNLVGIITATHPLLVGLTIGASIHAIVIWGAVIGSMFPLALQKLGLDPAAVSSPLIATIMDISGVTIYLAVATLILSL